ncbi:hypothetical protein KC354_g11436 [Hortaea werneckii]|nr:hypothetical protein KC354_g11436 [Hortaea werneckii]
MRFLLPVIAMSAVIQAAPSIPRDVNSIVGTGVGRTKEGLNKTINEVETLIEENINDKRSVDDFLDTMFTRPQNGTSTIADEISELVKQNINYYTLDTLQKQIENLEGTVNNKRSVDDVSDTVFQRLQGGTSQIADAVAKLVKQNINYYTLDTLQKQVKNLEDSVSERSV